MLSHAGTQDSAGAARSNRARHFEVHEMLGLARTGCLLLYLVCSLAAGASAAESADEDVLRPWVDYRDGAISLAFSQVPVQFAVNAIQARTGMQIIVPRQARDKTLNLRLRELPLESAMRSLVFSIGYSSFALTYDGSGRPVRAIILDAPPPSAEDGQPQPEKEQPAGLKPEEKEEIAASLQRWNKLERRVRQRIETRLRDLPPSAERDELVKEYGRRVLGIAE
jgi:hypothetical protein